MNPTAPSCCPVLSANRVRADDGEHRGDASAKAQKHCVSGGAFQGQVRTRLSRPWTPRLSMGFVPPPGVEPGTCPLLRDEPLYRVELRWHLAALHSPPNASPCCDTRWGFSVVRFIASTSSLEGGRRGVHQRPACRLAITPIARPRIHALPSDHHFIPHANTLTRFTCNFRWSICV